MLNELTLKNSYNTSDDDLVRDFFEPLLLRSAEYFRGVGYFTSGWLRENAVGLTAFAENGGVAKMIVSPTLVEEDWTAIKYGTEARRDPRLYAALERTITNLESELAEDSRNALAWLVADGILNLALAFPKDQLSGEFHDKFGIFRDKVGNTVSFNGSYNETLKGLRNYESIKVFASWDSITQPWVEEDLERFVRLWNNEDPNVEVVAMPEAAQRQISTYRTKPRPYRLPTTSIPIDGWRMPTVPDGFEIRDYQKAAIRAWFANEGRGTLEMATGTGKTATALVLITVLAKQLKEHSSTLTVVVVCPYRHLVDQWVNAASKFGIRSVKCYGNRESWWESVNREISTFTFQKGGVALLVTTNKTFMQPPFQEFLSTLRTPSLIVGDEAHNLGSQELRTALPENIEYRLALSATPERHEDDEGTEVLRQYFGNSVFQYGLAEAIDSGYLTRYEYYPELVSLTPSEEERYLEISSKIARKMVLTGEDPYEDKGLKSLLIQRARLIASAENKLVRLEELVSELRPISHCLFYCGDGRVSSPSSDAEQRQIDAVMQLLGVKLGLRVDQYIAETSGAERQRLTTELAIKKLDGLVAIRCLDEGVDIPQVRNAFIMASSTNPREFIQRRGRVLRKASGKKRARIWDMLVQPPTISNNSATYSTERKLLKRELSRAFTFAELAVNGPQARKKLRPLTETYHLLDL